MSLNLWLTVNGEDQKLNQTPTYITEMCLMGEDGEVASHITGDKCKGCLGKYFIWYRSSLNGVYESKKDHEDHVNLVESHIQRIKDPIPDNWDNVEMGLT